MRKKNLIQASAVMAVVGICASASAIPFDNTSGSSVLTATVGTGGDYPDLGTASVAFNTVSGGINSPWNLDVISNTTEANQVFFGGTFGATGSLTIKPASSNSATVEVVSTHLTGPAGIGGHIVFGVTDGTTGSVATFWDNRRPSVGKYTIDGSKNGTTSRDMTWRVGTSALSAASGHNHLISVAHDTDGMTIKNIRLEFYDTSASCAPIRTVGGGVVANSVPTVFPDNLTIENCDLVCTGSGANAFGFNSSIFPAGATGIASTGLVFRNNTVTCKQRGVFLNGIGDASIYNNTFNMVSGAAPGVIYTAYFPLGANGATGWTQNFYNNKATVNPAGVPTFTAAQGVAGALLDTASGGTINLYNNTFDLGVAAQTAPVDILLRGISDAVATCVVNAEHNSITIAADANVTAATANRVGGLVVAVAKTTGSFNGSNNIVRQLNIAGTSAVVTTVDATNITTSGNDLVTAAGGRIGRIGSTDYADLASWQTAGYDSVASGGQSADPTTTTPAWDSAFHFASKPISGLGTVTTSTRLTDIDGDARPASGAVPGADEPTVVNAVNDWSIYRD